MKPGEDRRLVHVFVGEPTRDLSEAAVTHDLKHIRIPCTSRRDQPLAILRARRVLKSHGVQVVHGHEIEGTLASDDSPHSLLIANGKRESARLSNSPELNTLDFLYGPPTNLQVVS